MAKLAPTTKAQVSGHKFLVRRMQHALVLGDISMIHDPLSSRRRALIFGAIAVVLIALGSGLLAWLRPDPNPGEAQLLRSDQSQLYVRVDETLHPVANLASARLIVGEAVEPTSIGNSALEKASLGTPIGIPDAPVELASPTELDPLASTPPNTWAACIAHPESDEPPFMTSATRESDTPDFELIVSVDQDLRDLPQEAAAYLTHQDRDWLVTSAGRAVLPSANSDEGRIIRRALNLSEPVVVPAEFLNAFAENPPIRLPEVTLLYSDNQTWAHVDGGIVKLSETQASMLADASAPLKTVTAEEIAGFADANDTAIDVLPETVPNLIDGEDWLCANADGAAVELSPVDSLVALPGNSPASYFTGLSGGAVAADTGNGVHLIEGTGRRHALPDVSQVDALGVAVQVSAWPIVRLLPEATALTRENALSASY